MTVLHVPFLPPVARTTGSLLPFASHTALGELADGAIYSCGYKGQGGGWRSGSNLLYLNADILDVVRWHRAGFRLYWTLISKVKKQVGRKRLSKEVRDLIFRMMAENPTWGAPRIHGELLMLGLDVSERSISRWMKHAPRDPELARRWLAFVRNHRDAIAAMDFFTVPTITFKLLYCFFIISHDRRQILHWNVTRYPASTWIAQQLREAFSYESAPRFLLFDHDQKYGLEVLAALRSLQINGVQTSIQSPWQNGVAERWVGSCRRDLLDHIIAVNERHLNKLLSDYVPITMMTERILGYARKRLVAEPDLQQPAG
jgi:putative transposase